MSYVRVRRVPGIWHKDHTTMLRRTTSILFASVLIAGGFAAAANAAPAKAPMRHAAPVHKVATMHKPMAKKMSAHGMRHGAPMMRARGGDAQNSTVDQLNAQSLQRATTGAPAQ